MGTTLRLPANLEWLYSPSSTYGCLFAIAFLLLQNISSVEAKSPPSLHHAHHGFFIILTSLEAETRRFQTQGSPGLEWIVQGLFTRNLVKPFVWKIIKKRGAGGMPWELITYITGPGFRSQHHIRPLTSFCNSRSQGSATHVCLPAQVCAHFK